MGGPAPLSKIVSVPSGMHDDACWKPVLVPGGILKLEPLPPRRQMIRPVRRSILYVAEVLRIETIRLRSRAIEIEFTWYGSTTCPGTLDPYL